MRRGRILSGLHYLVPSRHPAKVAAAMVIKSQTTLGNGWIAARLSMRTAANVSQIARLYRTGEISLPARWKKWEQKSRIFDPVPLCQCPSCGGRSLQGLPVRATKSTASINSRSPCAGGAPAGCLACLTNGSRLSQSSSVISKRSFIHKPIAHFSSIVQIIRLHALEVGERRLYRSFCISNVAHQPPSVSEAG